MRRGRGINPWLDVSVVDRRVAGDVSWAGVNVTDSRYDHLRVTIEMVVLGPFSTIFVPFFIWRFRHQPIPPVVNGYR